MIRDANIGIFNDWQKSGRKEYRWRESGIVVETAWSVEIIKTAFLAKIPTPILEEGGNHMQPSATASIPPPGDMDIQAMQSMDWLFKKERIYLLAQFWQQVSDIYVLKKKKFTKEKKFLQYASSKKKNLKIKWLWFVKEWTIYLRYIKIKFPNKSDKESSPKKKNSCNMLKLTRFICRHLYVLYVALF